MAKHRTKIRGAQPTIVAVDETDEGTSYELEITGHRISLPLELSRAWAERGTAAREEFIHYASLGWALFKPETVVRLRQTITRSRQQATYWHQQAATR